MIGFDKACNKNLLTFLVITESNYFGRSKTRGIIKDLPTCIQLMAWKFNSELHMQLRSNYANFIIFRLPDLQIQNKRA